MQNLKEIEENYKRLPTAKLISLIPDYKELPWNVSLILEKELISRGETEKAHELRAYIDGTISKPESLRDMSRQELQQMIEDRLEAGEPIESISIDLKDNGLDILDLLSDEDNKKRAIFNYMTRLKNQDITDETLVDDVQETFRIEKEEAEILNENLKKEGDKKQSIAYTILIVTGIISLLSFMYTGILVLPFLIIIPAIYWAYKGTVQKR